jgi:hypothetical protein
MQGFFVKNFHLSCIFNKISPSLQRFSTVEEFYIIAYVVVKNSVNKRIQEHLIDEFHKLELKLDSDVLVYTGPLVDGIENELREIVEELVNDKPHLEYNDRRLHVMLTTPGGSAHVVERFVNILRYFYGEVNFIIPDYAYSAGTIFCMSGDNILMDFFSVLGPIDPQVQNKEGRLVPAMGYLDKINELLEKAGNNTLSDAEFIILKEFDLAEVRGFEQARDLSIDLLKKWLVKYKFKNWTTHKKTNPGSEVTQEEKMRRAEEIATALSNNSFWKSHGRPINIEILENQLRLKIIDYSNESTLREFIHSYYMLSVDYIKKNDIRLFIHTRKYI